MSILDFYDKHMTKREIAEAITGKENKCAVCDNTLKKLLRELIEKKRVVYDESIKSYSLKKQSDYAGHIEYYHSAVVLLINRVISGNEFLVYIALCRNLQTGKNVTYDSLSNDLNIDKGDISRAIWGLHKARAIAVTKSPNPSGRGCYHVYKIAC